MVKSDGAQPKSDGVLEPPIMFVADCDAGVSNGDPALVRSASDERRARVHVTRARPGNGQAFSPEANPLLSPTRREPVSGVPDPNADVDVEPVR